MYPDGDPTIFKVLSHLESLAKLENGLTKLECLNLSYLWHVNDADLEHVEALTDIKELDLASTQVTNAGLKHLKGLGKLERLYLDHTEVTDGGLEQLNGLANLEHLSLTGLEVTDVGLKHLEGMTLVSLVRLQD